MFPTLDQIKAVLTEYGEPYLTPWAQWLHESWHAEPTYHLKELVLGNLAHRLALEFPAAYQKTKLEFLKRQGSP